MFAFMVIVAACTAGNLAFLAYLSLKFRRFTRGLSQLHYSPTISNVLPSSLERILRDEGDAMRRLLGTKPKKSD